MLDGAGCDCCFRAVVIDLFRVAYFSCSALATVPGLGLAVRHCTGVQFFATPDAIAMAAMSSCKVAWMAAVRRGMSR